MDGGYTGDLFADRVRTLRAKLAVEVVKRPDKAEGIVAEAHKLARIIWAMVVSGQPYDEAKAFDSTPAATARRLKNLHNQAHALNMKLVQV